MPVRPGTSSASPIDTTEPADGRSVRKETIRANWLAIESQLDHGGFFQIDHTAAVRRATAAKLTEIPSVLDFGAAGDGSTDDSNAFRVALREAIQVRVPAGCRCLVGDIEVEGRSLLGPGEIIKCADTKHALLLSGEASTLEGLRFSAQPSSGQPHACVRLGEGARDSLISHCSFKGGTDYRPTCYSAIAGAPDSKLGGTPYAVPADGLQILHSRFDGFVKPIFLHSIDGFTLPGNVIRRCSHDAIRIRERCEAGQITFDRFLEVGAPGGDGRTTRDYIDTYWSGRRLAIIGNHIDGCACIGLDIKGAQDRTFPDRPRSNGKIIIAANHIHRCR
jgi:hypothetical protein